MSKTKTPIPAKAAASAPAKQVASSDDMAFGRQNYILMIIGIVLLFIGYALMSGGKSNDPNVFNGDEIFSFRRITLAPIIVMLGYAIEVYAIVKKAD